MAKNSTQTNGNGATASNETKRAASKSEYINDEGVATRSPQADSTALRFSFDGIGETVTVALADIGDSIKHMAILQGLNIKLQRSYNTAKGNVQQMFDECSATAENLIAGVWTSEREGGGLRIGDLAEAVQAVLADEGKTVDLETIKAKLAADEATREKSKKNVKVAAHLSAIVARKAAERAAAAGQVASAHTGESGLDF